MHDGNNNAGPARTMIGYGLMVLAAIGLFFVIRNIGEHLTAPESITTDAVRNAPSAQMASGWLLHLLVALAAVIVVGRLLAWLFAYLRQPPVIGEVLAGICLGPSLLGRLWPEAGNFVLPASVAPSLSVVAQLGAIIYMFIVGLELNAATIRRHGHVSLAISHASIVVPFLLGAVMALWIYPTMSSGNVPFTVFALFFGVSMSITAFPVLARILTDRQMTKTDLGMVAIACAATDDVTAWCLLALVVGVAQAQIGAALWVVLLTVGYIVLVFYFVRPMLAVLLRRYCQHGLTGGVLAMLLFGMLLSSLATEAIGIHAIFGAFLFGAVIPHDSLVAEELVDKLRDFITAVLLPAYFAFTGMRTQIGLVTGWDQWLVCLAIIAVATVGKFGGTLVAARLTGFSWRNSASLGVLMNTRGLMELIVLNIGLDLGVISPTLFAMMVLMALATTMATSPILHALIPHPNANHRVVEVNRAAVASGPVAS